MHRKLIVRKREYQRERRVRSQAERAEGLANGTRSTKDEIQAEGTAALEAFLAGGRTVTQCPAGKKPKQRDKNYRPRV